MQRHRIGLIAVAAVALAATAAIASPARTVSAQAPTQRAALPASHTGGTLKLLYQGSFGSWDPQIDYTLEGWQLKQATQDGLVAFKKAQGTAAYTVVPDLATTIPTPTKGGKHWVFKLRSGIKFSNGKVVKPSDFLWTFQRIFKIHTPTASG